VAGFLKDQGLDDHAATTYSDTVNGGGALLAVTVPSHKVDEVEARRILDKYGATNIHLQAARRILS
jgi:predicted metal-dependent TIM-barrel fold hydrolase